jgi:translation initiation factor IF-1
MVKNTGGTKTKGMARKHLKPNGGGGGALRIPENELEQVVIVTKMLGNGMCEVYNNDNKRFIAHIRNKFKGRHRRSNDINVNTYILIGLRDWENPFKNCDVIFVYDHSQFNQLYSNPSIHMQNISARDTTNSFNTNNYKNDNDILFDTFQDNFSNNLNLNLNLNQKYEPIQDTPNFNDI